MLCIPIDCMPPITLSDRTNPHWSLMCCRWPFTRVSYLAGKMTRSMFLPVSVSTNFRWSLSVTESHSEFSEVYRGLREYWIKVVMAAIAILPAKLVLVVVRKFVFRSLEWLMFLSICLATDLYLKGNTWNAFVQRCIYIKKNQETLCFVSSSCFARPAVPSDNLHKFCAEAPGRYVSCLHDVIYKDNLKLLQGTMGATHQAFQSISVRTHLYTLIDTLNNSHRNIAIQIFSLQTLSKYRGTGGGA